MKSACRFLLPQKINIDMEILGFLMVSLYLHHFLCDFTEQLMRFATAPPACW